MKKNRQIQPQLTSNEVREIFKNLSPQQAWMEIIKKYGDNFWYKGIFVTCDPNLVKTLLLAKEHTKKRSKSYKLLSKIPGAHGLLFLEGEDWQKSAQIAMSVLRKENINSFSEVIHQTTLTFAEEWQSRGNLEDLFTSLMELGAAIMLKVSCNLDPQNELSQELSSKLIEYKTQTMTSDFRVRLDEFDLDISKIRYLPNIISHLTTLKKLMNDIEQTIERIFLIRKLEFKKTENYLYNLKYAGFSFKEIASQLNHLYGAFNAIDYSITCAFYLLSQNNEWITILRTEFEQVLKGRLYPDFCHFPQLIQTNKFMKEVFRLYPVAMAVARQTTEPICLEDETIPEQTEVLILLYALQNHPKFWDDPQVFNPHRWSEKASTIPYTYIPFLEGPRQCLGKHWAILNFVIILHALLSNYDVEILKSKVEINRYLIPRFAETIPCKIHEIDLK